MAQKKQKPKTKTMKEQERKDFDELYRYVRTLIGYDSDTPLPSKYVLRLKGIQVGKFMENYSIQAPGSDNEYGGNGNIQSNIILKCVKLYKNDIENGWRRNGIEEYEHKFYYLCKVVENHLQDVIDLERRLEKANEKLQEPVPDNQTEEIQYTPQKNKTTITPSYVEELWK